MEFYRPTLKYSRSIENRDCVAASTIAYCSGNTIKFTEKIKRKEEKKIVVNAKQMQLFNHFLLYRYHGRELGFRWAVIRPLFVHAFVVVVVIQFAFVLATYKLS